MSSGKCSSFCRLVINSSCLKKLPLPLFYYNLCEELGFPTGQIKIIAVKDGKSFPARMDDTGNDFILCGGWDKVVSHLNVEVSDSLVFTLEGRRIFKVLVLKYLQNFHANDCFYHILTRPASKEVVLFGVRRSIEHMFGDHVSKHRLTIKFGDFKQWSVRVKLFFGEYFLQDGWKNICLDLNLKYGQFLVFEKDGDYSVDLKVFEMYGQEMVLEEHVDASEYQNPNEVGAGSVDNSGDDSDEEMDNVQDDSDNGVESTSDDDTGSSDNDHVNGQVEVVCKSTYRFRFPKEFAAAGKFETVKTFNIKLLDGPTFEVCMRVEMNRGLKRYAISCWKALMKEAGMKAGRKYHFKYDKEKALLVVSLP